MKTIQNKAETNKKIKKSIMEMLVTVNDTRKLQCIHTFIQGIYVR